MSVRLIGVFELAIIIAPFCDRWWMVVAGAGVEVRGGKGGMSNFLSFSDNYMSGRTSASGRCCALMHFAASFLLIWNS